jgi:hypothetical protein
VHYILLLTAVVLLIGDGYELLTKELPQLSPIPPSIVFKAPAVPQIQTVSPPLVVKKEPQLPLRCRVEGLINDMRTFSNDWPASACEMAICPSPGGTIDYRLQNQRVAKWKKQRGDEFGRRFLGRLRALAKDLKSHGLDRAPIGDAYANPLDSTIQTMTMYVGNDFFVETTPQILQEFVGELPQAECGVTVTPPQ